MGAFTRDEIERAFADYQAAGATAGRTGDWASWADLFTEDATYVEHHYGRLEGREAIRSWISETMATFPGNRMPLFPIDWYLIDEDRGWVVCQVENRMDDPGDGSVHQASNITILHYAGDGRWSYEEDVYNPAHFVTMLAGWQERVDALGCAPGTPTP
jgi:uncharacterized protein (TIGR02246 family)